MPWTQLTSILEGQPSQTRPFPIQTRVIWVLNVQNMNMPLGSWLTETENGFMEPKMTYAFRFGDWTPLCSSADQYQRWMPFAGCIYIYMHDPRTETLGSRPDLAKTFGCSNYLKIYDHETTVVV